MLESYSKTGLVALSRQHHPINRGTHALEIGCNILGQETQDEIASRLKLQILVPVPAVLRRLKVVGSVDLDRDAKTCCKEVHSSQLTALHDKAGLSLRLEETGGEWVGLKHQGQECLGSTIMVSDRGCSTGFDLRHDLSVQIDGIGSLNCDKVAGSVLCAHIVLVRFYRTRRRNRLKDQALMQQDATAIAFACCRIEVLFAR
jgi:hypothetical protein